MVRIFAALVAILFVCAQAPAAWAQMVTGTRLTVGPNPSPPEGSTVRIVGTGTTGGTGAGSGLLFADAEGDVIKRALAKIDMPAGIAWVDQANAFTQANTFAGTTTFNGAATFNAGFVTSGQRGTVSPWLVNDTTGARLLQAGDGGYLTIGRDAGANAWIQFEALTAPVGHKRWRLGDFGGHFTAQALSDDQSGNFDLWRGIADAGGVPREFAWGAGLQSVVPSTSLYTRLGSWTNPYSILHVGELRAAAFVVNETQAYTEASLKVGRGSMLVKDAAAGETVVFLKTRFTHYLDFLILRGLGANNQPQFEVMKVTSAQAADCSLPTPNAACGTMREGFAIYVARNEDGSGANDWKKGDAAVGMDRWLDVFSDSGGFISYGNAVLGDKPNVYWNFDNITAPYTVPNLAAGFRAYSGAKTALTPGPNVSYCGWGGWYAASPAGASCGAWVPTVNGITHLTGGTFPVPELNTTSMGYAVTLEFVWHTPGGNFTFFNPIARFDGGTTNANFVVYYYGQGQGVPAGLILYGNAGGTWTNLTAWATIPFNTWNHTVMTYDAWNGGRIYNNGVLIVGSEQPPLTGNPLGGTNQPLQIANLADGTGTAQHLSELAIYDYALPADAVSAHWNALQVMRPNIVNGPSAVGYIATGANWYDQAPRWAVGNLQGLYNYATETYGLAAGDSTKNWLAVDPGNGVRMMGGNVPRVWLNPNGTLQMFDENGARGVYLNAASGLVLGGDSIVAGKPYGQFSSTQFALCASNTNCTLRFNGTSGDITSTGSILLSTGGNVTSTGAFRLAQATGLEMVRMPAATFAKTNALSIVPALGGSPSLAVYQESNGIHHFEQFGDGNTLIIGDGNGFDGQATYLRLWNNGNIVSPFPEGHGIDLAYNGIWFRAQAAGAGAGVDNFNKHIRPVTDADMYLGSATYRFRNLHMSLPQSGQVVKYLLVGGSNRVDQLHDETSLAYWNQGVANNGAAAFGVMYPGGGTCHLYITNGLIYYTSCPQALAADLRGAGQPLPEDALRGGPPSAPPIDFEQNEPNATPPPPLVPAPLPWPGKETPVVTPLEPMPAPIQPEEPGPPSNVTPGPPAHVDPGPPCIDGKPQGGKPTGGGQPEGPPCGKGPGGKPEGVPPGVPPGSQKPPEHPPNPANPGQGGKPGTPGKPPARIQP